MVELRPSLPPLSQIIALAIESEARASLEINEQHGPLPVRTASGLAGCAYELVGYTRPYYPIERRRYVMVADARFAYAATYVASPELYAQHLGKLTEVVESLRSVTASPTRAPAASSPFSYYAD
jgi:hypothetical protein